MTGTNEIAPAAFDYYPLRSVWRDEPLGASCLAKRRTEQRGMTGTSEIASAAFDYYPLRSGLAGRIAGSLMFAKRRAEQRGMTGTNEIAPTAFDYYPLRSVWRGRTARALRLGKRDANGWKSSPFCLRQSGLFCRLFRTDSCYNFDYFLLMESKVGEG